MTGHTSVGSCLFLLTLFWQCPHATYSLLPCYPWGHVYQGCTSTFDVGKIPYLWENLVLVTFSGGQMWIRPQSCQTGHPFFRALAISARSRWAWSPFVFDPHLQLITGWTGITLRGVNLEIILPKFCPIDIIRCWLSAIFYGPGYIVVIEHCYCRPRGQVSCVWVVAATIVAHVHWQTFYVSPHYLYTIFWCLVFGSTSATLTSWIGAIADSILVSLLGYA